MEKRTGTSTDTSTDTSTGFGTGFGLLAILSWGALGILGKMSEAISPWFVLAVSFGVAAMLGAGICVSTGRQFRGISGGRILLFAGLLTGYHALYLTAFRYGPALHITLLNYLWPGFLILFGNLFFKLGSGRAGLAGAGLGFVGVALLIGPGLTQGAGRDALFGYVLALSGAMLWALYSNLRRLDRQDAIVSLTLICGVSAVLSAGVELAGGSGFPALDAGQWGIILLLAVGPAGGAFFLWDKGMKAGNAPLLSVLGYGAPVISSALMVVFGYADLSLMIFVSTGLIAAGGLVTGLRTAALPVRAVQPCPGSPGRPVQSPD